MMPHPTQDWVGLGYVGWLCHFSLCCGLVLVVFFLFFHLDLDRDLNASDGRLT